MPKCASLPSLSTLLLACACAYLYYPGFYREFIGAIVIVTFWLDLRRIVRPVGRPGLLTLDLLLTSLSSDTESSDLPTVRRVLVLTRHLKEF